ncbi:MAG: class I SAM-dependent methyltransferase [Patescibacteria group bacterium]
MSTHLKGDGRKLFVGAASYYAKYRPGYPKAFFEFARERFHLDGNGRLLDLGCGTGQILLPFAADFEEVVGLDPEPEMLAEGKRQAKKQKVKNAVWILSKAENINKKKIGHFRLVAMGASFHWMEEQNKVLQTIYDITESGGGLIFTHNPSSGWRDKGEKWKVVRKQIVQKYLGAKRRAGNVFYKEKEEYWEDVLDTSPFGGHEEWNYKYPLSWTLKEVIGYLYATSFASRRLFGNRLADFERELKDALLKIEPSGIFREQVRLQVLVSKR